MVEDWKIEDVPLMDEVDHRIIEILKRDSRMPVIRIGRELGMPDNTVRGRINRMMKRGVIKRFTVLTELDAELGEMSTERFAEFVEAAQATIQGQRNETDLLWAAVKGSLRRIEALETRINSDD